MSAGSVPAPNPLARSLAIVYTVLAIYASLHPFSGWSNSGISPFEFLKGGWPRYTTVFDLVINVLAYIPMGFLWFPVAASRYGRIIGAVLVCALLTLMSGSIETIQNFLPSRVPSHLDLLCNSAGALIGVLLAQHYGGLLLSESRLLQWRHRHIANEPLGDYGLVLLLVWLLIQLSPENLMFGSGNLRQMLGLPAPLPFGADRFSMLEGLIAMLGTLGAALVLSVVFRITRYWYVLLFIFVAVLVRSFAAAILIEPSHFTHWLTAANLGGGVIGLLLAWGALRWPLPARRLTAAMVIMAGTGLINSAPDNPYLQQAMQVWQQGHFLNFNGAVRLASSVWPFFALTFLMSEDRRSA